MLFNRASVAGKAIAEGEGRAKYALAVLALGALVFVACGNPGDGDANSTGPTITPFPTVSEIDNPTLTPDATEESAAPQAELVDTFRGDVQPEALAVFGLTGRAGESFRVEVRMRVGQPDIALQLTGSGGEEVASVDEHGPGEAEVIGELRYPTDGYYELAVRSLEGEGQIEVLVYRLPPEALTGGGLIPGLDQPVPGTMDRPATFHTYYIHLERGQRVDVAATATSGDLDLLFEFFDPEGVRIALRDDTVDFDPVLFNYMPSVSGDYSLVVSNFEETTGAYEVVVRPSESNGQLVTGRKETITLPDENGHTVWLTFIGKAGDGLRLDVTPANPATDATIALYDIFGNRIAYADFEGPGAIELLGQAQFPYDGPYQVEIGTLTQGGVVSYQARLVPAAEIGEGGLLEPDPEIFKRANIVSNGVVHAYWFEGLAGQPVSVDAEPVSGSLDLAFALYDPAGNLLEFHDNDRNLDPVLENFRLPVDGPYYIILSLLNDNRGEYQLRVAFSGATAPSQ